LFRLSKSGGGFSHHRISFDSFDSEITGIDERRFYTLLFRFGSTWYAAGTWKRKRRVIVKAEHTARGPNPRYVVTNLSADAQWLYDKLYCARGEAENRIKEQQMCLFADRTSCMNWLPNQFRLLLSSLAYTLMEAIRSQALKGTQLARARCDTIRVKLFKIGAVMIRNTRQIRFLLSSAYPYQDLFTLVSRRLATL
jgi:hypothetical protein